MSSIENLSRAECDQRADIVSDVTYSVELDLSTAHGPQTAALFRSITTVTFAATPGANTWVDLIADSVESVTLNGTELDPTEVFNGARIELADLAEHNTVVVDAQCRYMRSGEGLHRFVDPVDNETYLYTQFEVADARRMYACFEQPSVKAPFQLTVTAPNHWRVLSNAATPESTPASDTTATWQFEPTGPISSYITALVAGPYHAETDEYSGEFGTYPLGVYCRASMAEFLDADDVFTITKQGFEFFESQFKVGYPFGKYDQIFVPEFNAGAMENAACVTFYEDYVFRSRVTDAAYETRSNTILHEMAHMWFGDLVTMHWWDDLWLNESFAEWAAHWANSRATRFTDAWTTFLNQRKAWAYRQDQLPSTHPIAADMVDLEAVRVNFDGITYAKGASALKQLVAWVGEPEFIEGLRSYFRDHAWSNTRLTDLLGALSQASGRDLSDWSAQWLQTSGVNLMQPQVKVVDGVYESVVIEQLPPSKPDGVAPTLRDHRMGVGLYDRVDGRLQRRETVAIDITGSQTPVTAFTGQPEPDLLLLNDDDLTFTKIRLDESSTATAIASIGEVDESLPRALLWGAAWDMTRDGEMSTGDYLALALSGLPAESDVGVVQQVLRQLDSAISLYATDEHRSSYEQTLASTLWELVHDEPAGTDRQLAFLRGFISSASTDSQVDAVASLLDGSQQVDGVTIDTDLRWSLLDTLVINGRASDADIDAELANDNTASGLRHAQFARAARPSAQAKDLAWREALTNHDLPNHLLGSTIGGIMVPGHRHLLRDHVEQYYDSIVSSWTQRTPEMAQQIVTGLFPYLLVEPATVERATGFLADNPDLPAGARRIIDEAIDGVARSLHCQKADADEA